MALVFLCYASQDHDLADRVQLALVAAGHQVFFDEHSLNAGDDYNGRILSAIAACDAFIFLASNSSLADGKYTLSELKFIRQRWPSPAGKVLTVNVSQLSANQLPSYLAAATILSVSGNVPVEVRAALDVMLDRQRSVDALTSEVARVSRRRTIFAWTAGTFIIAAAILGVIAYPTIQLYVLNAHLRLADPQRFWIGEHGEVRIAEGWHVVTLRADDVKFKDRVVYLSLSREGKPPQKQTITEKNPKAAVVISDRQYLLEVHDFADNANTPDQAQLSISSVSVVGR